MDKEQEQFESELRRVAPAPVPADLMDRLRSSKTFSLTASRPEPRRGHRMIDIFMGLRWLVAATSVVVAAILFLRLESPPDSAARKSNSAASPANQANAVQVDHALVNSFDAVAELPSGEPVRFRCSQWRDDVVMRDPSHGMVIEQSIPRMEVVAVRFETY